MWVAQVLIIFCLSMLYMAGVPRLYLAGLARPLWQARHATQTQPALGSKRHLATLVRSGTGAGPGLGDARLDRSAGLRVGGRWPKKSRVADEALGRSRGGLSTKIHILVDALGNPLRVVLGPGQQADCRRAADLLPAAQGAGNVLADKAQDTDAILALGAVLGAKVVILSKRTAWLRA